MFFRTQAPTWQTSVLDAMLSALTTVPTGVLLATPKIELFTAGGPFTGRDQWTSFTRCTFNGYAAAALTLAKPGNLLNNDQAAVGSVVFEATGVLTATENAIGYMLSDGTANVYFGELFPTPFPFAQGGDFLELDVILPLILRPLFAVFAG